ncbi:MAG: hypothetical protein ACLFQW_09195 [Spirochaetaceae bacterium]
MACCDEEKKNDCQKPERLQDKPENCSPEQIKECHGESEEEHPCCDHPDRRC